MILDYSMYLGQYASIGQEGMIGYSCSVPPTVVQRLHVDNQKGTYRLQSEAI